jgi:hypothetical protein
MAQECKPGQIVPESGIYTITHDRQACGYAARGDGGWSASCFGYAGYRDRC